MEIRDTGPLSRLFSNMVDFHRRCHLEFLFRLLIDWLKKTSAILELENNRVHFSQNNSLLSFSAPDWLPLI